MSDARFSKVHIGELRVPMREILLSNGERVRLYDTSGPYTDRSATTDLTQGLPPLRREWILARGDVAARDEGPLRATGRRSPSSPTPARG